MNELVPVNQPVNPLRILWWATGIPLVVAAVRYFMLDSYGISKKGPR